jgi:predicted lipoprotein with Yx(FWY)xxD motif
MAQGQADWQIVTDASGLRQWTYKGQPLYLFEDDTKPGDRLGESRSGWLAMVVE